MDFEDNIKLGIWHNDLRKIYRASHKAQRFGWSNDKFWQVVREPMKRLRQYDIKYPAGFSADYPCGPFNDC